MHCDEAFSWLVVVQSFFFLAEFNVFFEFILLLL